MFYVIKTTDGRFRGEDREPVEFALADRFDRPDPHVALEQGDRWVGPCEEGDYE